MRNSSWLPHLPGHLNAVSAWSDDVTFGGSPVQATPVMSGKCHNHRIGGALLSTWRSYLPATGYLVFHFVFYTLDKFIHSKLEVWLAKIILCTVQSISTHQNSESFPSLVEDEKKCWTSSQLHAATLNQLTTACSNAHLLTCRAAAIRLQCMLACHPSNRAIPSVPKMTFSCPNLYRLNCIMSFLFTMI